MRFLLFCLLCLVGVFIFNDNYAAVSFGVTFFLVLQIITAGGNSLVFREFVLLLYSLNYLFAPSITYLIDDDKISYAMKIAPDVYFPIAFIGFCCFVLGMFCLPTKIFTPNLGLLRKAISSEESLFFHWTVIGLFFKLAQNLVSEQFAFFIYLLSLLRFVGVFALFLSDKKKYGLLILFVFVLEMYMGFKSALFHDAMMWLIFFLIFYLYTRKPSLTFKIIGSLSLIIFVLLIQAFKKEYRQLVWIDGGAGSFETISAVGVGNANAEVIGSESNLLETLNRGNQAWIFASTIDNMDRNKDFQGMQIVRLYFESALLPRFLAPYKITAGDRTIFNKFSGHNLAAGTAMGLGVFADGYIAYGVWGVYCFTFFLGLVFALTFRLLQNWLKISPLYILFLFPMLNYAVRPDCELQTTINHLAKSMLLFGALVYLTKYRFTLASENLLFK